jgi:hypothetical protein
MEGIMNRGISKKLTYIMVVFFLFSMIHVPAFAEPGENAFEPSGADMLTDLVFVRTTSFVSTVLGTAVFLVSLPFTAAGGNVGEAAEKLVVNPGKLTFCQPLGDLDVMEVWPFKYDRPER